MQHDIVAEGLGFPEGPLILPGGDLLVCEMARQRIVQVAMDGAISVIAEVPGCPNGAALGPDGAVYVCNNGGWEFGISREGYTRIIGPPPDHKGGSIQRVDIATGELRTLYSHYDGTPLCGPNDLVFDRQGGLWFTDYGKTRANKMDVCSAYYCRIDGSFIRAVTGPFYRANGIALSPDDNTLYVAETLTGRLWAFDIAGPGEIRHAGGHSPNGGRAVYTLCGISICDSIAVEACGNICVTTLREGAITVVSPDGDLVEVIRYPDPLPTNICFGGDDMMTAFVTLSATGRIARSRWSRPGLRLPFQRD